VCGLIEVLDVRGKLEVVGVGARVIFFCLLLSRTIMGKAARLPGRAAKIERPSTDEIKRFVLGTGGGKGVVLEDDFFDLIKCPDEETEARLNQVAAQQREHGPGIDCGKFYWKGDSNDSDSAPPANYIIVKKTPEEHVNIHLLK